MQWNYQKIEYFLKVAETLNFSKAAKELYISPQSLNKQIILLEEELGEPLFERTTRTVRLTALGKRMLQTFRPAVEEFQKAAQSIERYLQRKQKTVRIAFFQAISKKEVIAPIANYLRACDPTIQVELQGGEIDEVIEWLYQGKCDLVITNIHDFEVWPETKIVSFVETPAVVTISMYHPWNTKKVLTIEDLGQAPVLLLERKKELEENSFYRHLHAKERLYASNFSSLLANLEMEECYAVIPKLFESMNQMGLQYMDLPKECAFSYRMAAIYKEENRWSELFDNLNNLAEEGIIEIL